MNVLVSSAGRRVELVEMLRAACGGRVVAVDIDPTAPALYHADVATSVPGACSPEMVPALSRLCRRHEIGLVVPTIDPELLPLALGAGSLAEAGTRVLIASPAAVATALDKLECAGTLVAAALPAVPTQLWRETAPPFDLPVVVKPRKGSAGAGVRVIEEEYQWTAPPAGLDWLVQPRIEGPEVTIDVVSDGGGRVLAMGARQRLKVRGGEVERARTVAHQPYLDLAGSIAVTIGIEGAFNFQVFLGSGSMLVGEVNPRFGGGAPLSEHAGARLAEVVCHWAECGSWPTGSLCVARPDVTMTRHDRSVFLEAHEQAW